MVFMEIFALRYFFSIPIDALRSTKNVITTTKRPDLKSRAAYIINRKPSVGTVVSTFKEKPMTKVPSIASVVRTNKIVHDAFSKKRNSKYEKVQTK